MSKGKSKPSKPKPPSDDDLIDTASNQVRDVLCKVLGDVSEEAYCRLSLNALDVVKTGLEMRLSEIEAEMLDGDDEAE